MKRFKESLIGLQGLLDDTALDDGATIRSTTLGEAVAELGDQIDLVLRATRGRKIDMAIDRPMIARIAALMMRVERLSPRPDA